MMLGIDPTIHRFKKKSSSSWKIVHFVPRMIPVTPQAQFLPLSIWRVVRTNKKQNRSVLPSFPRPLSLVLRASSCPPLFCVNSGVSEQPPLPHHSPSPVLSTPHPPTPTLQLPEQDGCWTSSCQLLGGQGQGVWVASIKRWAGPGRVLLGRGKQRDQAHGGGS